MLTMYGIKNCDTVKKARRWLEDNQVEYSFHDLRVDGVNNAQVKRWLEALGWESVINTRSTTWRQLADKDKAGLTNSTAVVLIAANPTLVKRPLLDTGKSFILGFKPEEYQRLT